jgi:site-specific DNA-methyltransferase (adenine-specific)
MREWYKSFWTDIRGASTRTGHPAPYPVSLAERLVRMFSFAGDTVLDPFAGTGTTGLAAMAAGRNSICNEIEPKYFEMAVKLMKVAQEQPPGYGAPDISLVVKGKRISPKSKR